MRLTNFIRNAFVAAAMADVPKVDYEQEIRDLFNKLYKAKLKTLGLDHTEPARLRNLGVSAGNEYVAANGLTRSEADKLAEDPRFTVLAAEKSAQSQKLSALQIKLEGVAMSVTTRKALIELLPEFEKYLPAEEAKTKNLPAISNLVGDFVRAGWPKNQKKGAQATQATT